MNENANLPENPAPKAEEQPDILRGIYEWLELFVFSFALVLVVITFVMRHSPVHGSSMYPTLEENDLLIVSGIGYTPENGDIIVAQSPGLGYDEPIVKRVIATGGQTVDIDFATWTVYVDGEKIEEYGAPLDGSYTVNYDDTRVMLSSDILFPLYVPEGYVFVMGDNRNRSQDSRNSIVGLIDNRMVTGEVKFRLFPLHKIGVPK